jgi:hypothetical protein
MTLAETFLASPKIIWPAPKKVANKLLVRSRKKSRVAFWSLQKKKIRAAL